MDQTLTVVDTSGVHKLRLLWCNRSSGEEKRYQLLPLRLYPASVSQPKTAFTFRVLDDYLLSNRISGTATQSYYERLRRLTNAAFPDQVPVRPGSSLECCLADFVQDRYRELLRVSRQWRSLEQLRRNGFGHLGGDVDPGQSALGCVACPRPGVNLMPGWEQDEEW